MCQQAPLFLFADEQAGSFLESEDSKEGVMARMDMQTFAPAAVVGILSAAANVVEKQAKAKAGDDPANGKPGA